MRLNPHAAAGAILTAICLAAAPAAGAAQLTSSDPQPLVSLDDTDPGALDWTMEGNHNGVDGLSFFRANSTAAVLTLAGDSNVGLGEVNPQLDLHIHTNNTPAIRLQQDNTGGFTAQTWDIGANEANFFVRDATGGSKLPFRIRPGAPTSSLDIRANGNVGVGTDTPDTALEVQRAGGPILRLTDAVGSGAPVSVWDLAAGQDFALKTPARTTLKVTGSGDLTSTGALAQNADAAALENRADADPAAVLAAVTQIPVGYFEYTADPANARHLAPVGADFRAAFNLGGADGVLAPADLGGVALVAIKGLAANDATFATKATVSSIDDRLKAAEAQLGTVAGSVPSLAPVNQQIAALTAQNATAQKQIAALEKQNTALLKRLAKVEKTTKKLARRR